MAVSKRLRYEILTRDGHRCRYCGATAPDVKLVIDHVTPTALGGRDEPSNLVTACEPCNSGKTSTIPGTAVVADVADDAVRWASAMKQAVAEMEAEEQPKLAYRQAFLDAWNEWTVTWNGKEEPLPLPEDWRSSVERYRLAGIPATAWVDLIEPGAASRKVRPADVFRYTCGVANNRVQTLQERTKVLVGASAAPASDSTDTDAIVREAAFRVWLSGMSAGDEPVPTEQIDQFRRSLTELSHWDTCEPGRIVAAAQHATYFSFTTITEALRDMDRDAIWRAWITAWPTTYVPGNPEEPFSGSWIGEPSDSAKEHVKEQIEKLLDTSMPPVFRLTQAATHAGFHKTSRLYLGLTDDELQVTGEHGAVCRVAELWRRAYAADGEQEPTSSEVQRFYESVRTAAKRYSGEPFGMWTSDLFEAAAWAGAYRDPDVSTCLPLKTSVFAAAAAIPPLPE